jgi:hypothetical protein
VHRTDGATEVNRHDRPENVAADQQFWPEHNAMSVAALGLRFRITTPNSAPRQHLDDACGHIAPRDHRVVAEFVVD